MVVFFKNDVAPNAVANTCIMFGKIIPFHQLPRRCDIENAMAVARKFARGFQDAPRPWMNAHWSVKSVAIYARKLALPVVKTHQLLHLLDGDKCRFESTAKIGSIDCGRLNFYKRAQ